MTAAKGAGVISVTEPEFDGTITGTIKGVAGTIDVIAIGETAYLEFFTPDYRETDLDTLNAPNPAMFFDPATGISSLLTQTSNPVAAGQTRAGAEVLDKISGTLPGRSSRTCSTSATAPAPSRSATASPTPTSCARRPSSGRSSRASRRPTCCR